VTHEPDIAAFSSRTIMLRDGRVMRDSVNENKKSAKEVLAALPVNDDYVPAAPAADGETQNDLS